MFQSSISVIPGRAERESGRRGVYQMGLKFSRLASRPGMTTVLLFTGLSLLACSEAPTIRETITKKTVPDMLQYDAELAAYLGLEYGDGVEEVKAKVSPDFSKEAGGEGKAEYAISVTKLDTGNAVLRANAKNLPDDSLKEQELVAIFVGQGEDEPKLTEYGLRIKCWRAADPNAWTTKLCP